MPQSHISMASVSQFSKLAEKMALNNTKLRIKAKIALGELSTDDIETYKREYSSIYTREYYNIYNQLSNIDNGSARVVYVTTDNSVTKRYFRAHAPVRFSRTNLLIRVNNTNKTVKIGRFNYPIDKDISPETKEAFLITWPGPLDKLDTNLKRKITTYIYTLSKHDSSRRIKYSTNDDQRKVILSLLAELLNRNGIIDATSINKLLLQPEQTEIVKDRRPLETLQRYLLSGDLIEAVRFSREKKLFDHAQLLSILYKYQKTGYYNGDSTKLKDDTYVRTAEEFIKSIEEHKTLNLVYRSLLNIIIQGDPESRLLIESADVGNDTYEFAMLSANNCPMKFDQSNEIFKLITSVKHVSSNGPDSPIGTHLISLGYGLLENNETLEDLSLRSNLSFREDDNYVSRTLKISNIDKLVLNEVYEYCLNLARGTCNPDDYEYIIDLIPYKLIFAGKLFDYGLYEMFSCYLNSLQRALMKLRLNPAFKKDPYYDWQTIEQVVESLAETWSLFQGGNPDLINKMNTLPTTTGLSTTRNSNDNNSTSFPAPTTSTANNYLTNNLYNPYQPIPNEYRNDYMDSPQNDYPSLPYQGESVYAGYQPPPPLPSHSQSQSLHNVPPTQAMSHLTLRSDINEFEPDVPPQDEVEAGNAHGGGPLHQQHDLSKQYRPQHQLYNDYSNNPSRRASASASQSIEAPLFSPPSFGHPGTHNSNHHEARQNHEAMTSSSPVNRGNTSKDGHASRMVDSFNAPYSPINEYDDMIPTCGNNMDNQFITNNANQVDSSSKKQTASANSNTTNNNDNNIGSNNSNMNSNSNDDNKQQQARQKSSSAADQQAGFFTNIIGSARSLLPRSNSKPMNLPDDSNKPIVFDELKGWVDTTASNADDGDDPNDAPPTMNISSPPNYSFVPKAPSNRYPKRNF